MKVEGPDGFHSWVVAAGCCVLYLFMYGMCRISGLLYVETMLLFDVNHEDASFPYVLAVTMRYVSGPFSGLLARRIGIRNVVILGCLMGCVGVGTCFFAKSIVTVIIFWGVIHGMGAGFATCLLPQVVNLFFKKHTTKMYGLTYAGSSLSGFILTPITEFLLRTYGLSGTYLILSGMILNGLAAAILLKKPNFTITASEPENPTTFGNKPSKEYGKNDVVVGLGYRLIPHYSLLKTDVSDINDISRKIIDVSVINHLIRDIDSNGDSKTNKFIENNAKWESLENSSDYKNGQLFSPTSEESLVQTRKDGAKDFKSMSLQILDINTLSASTDELLCTSNKDINAKFLTHTFTSENGNNCPMKRSSSIVNSKEIPYADFIPAGRNRRKSWFHDISVFKDPVYLCLCIGEALSTFLFVVTPTILVDYGLDKGIPVEDSTYLLMAFSVCDMIGSVVFGWLIDTNILSKAHFTSVCFCVSAGSFVLLAFSSTFIMMAFGIIMEGLSLGALAPIFPGIISEYIDKTKQTIAISSIGFLYVPISFTVSPLIGYFRDYLNSYVYMFYLMCGISITSCLLFLFLPRIAKCRIRT